MEITREKSEQQAALIMQLGFIASALDIEYLRECAREIMQQASHQESMAVLNPRHPQSKNILLRSQGVALRKLCDYVDALKEIDRNKEQVSVDEQHADTISKLFM
jgi:hypothetical protein